MNRHTSLILLGYAFRQVDSTSELIDHIHLLQKPKSAKTSIPSTATLFKETLCGGAAPVKSSGLGVELMVELKYPMVLVVADISCCVIAADVVVAEIGSELVGDSCGGSVALDIVLLIIEVDGGPVKSVGSWYIEAH